jgi:hypothetical protein
VVVGWLLRLWVEVLHLLLVGHLLLLLLEVEKLQLPLLLLLLVVMELRLLLLVVMELLLHLLVLVVMELQVQLLLLGVVLLLGMLWLDSVLVFPRSARLPAAVGDSQLGLGTAPAGWEGLQQLGQVAVVVHWPREEGMLEQEPQLVAG